MTSRHPQNAPGNWYVDTRCIDCGASRTVAPGLIVEGGNQSVFARQPETADEFIMAWRARLLCPTASVRTERQADVPHGVFPEEMTQDVYRLGYNAKSSYGAHAFAIRRSSGNAMVDAPRWTRAVVEQFEAWDGLTDILLTHRDDVGDAERYAAHFGARVWIHEADRDAARFADRVITGREVAEIGPISWRSPFPATPPAAWPTCTTGGACSRELTGLELCPQRPGSVQGLLLVFLAGTDQIAAAARGISLRMGVCGTRRKPLSSSRRNERAAQGAS